MSLSQLQLQQSSSTELLMSPRTDSGTPSHKQTRFERPTSASSPVIGPKLWPKPGEHSLSTVSLQSSEPEPEKFLGSYMVNWKNYKRVNALLQGDRVRKQASETRRKEGRRGKGPASGKSRQNKAEGGASPMKRGLSTSSLRRGSESQLIRRPSDAMLKRQGTMQVFFQFDQAELEEAFQYFDMKKNGKITLKDLKTGPIRRGFLPDMADKDIRALMPPNDKFWTMETFAEVMKTCRLESVKDDPVKEAFKFYDPHDTGFVDPDTFRKIMSDIGMGTLSDSEMAMILEIADMDGDGQISMDDYRNLLVTLDVRHDAAQKQSNIEDILHKRAIKRIIEDRMAPIDIPSSAREMENGIMDSDSGSDTEEDGEEEISIVVPSTPVNRHPGSNYSSPRSPRSPRSPTKSPTSPVRTSPRSPQKFTP